MMRSPVVELVASVLFRVLRVADFHGHLHDFFGGAAVGRAFERTHRAGHRGVQRRVGGRGDAGGERGCVDAVLGMEDEVNVHQGDGLIVRRFVEEHVEEVAGVVEVGVGRDRLQAVADPMVRGDNGGSLGGEAQRFADVGFFGIVLRFFVKSGQADHRSLEDIHGMRRLHGVDDGDDLVGYAAIGA